MAWYDEAIFYHIYPLGMTGAPKENTYGEPESRLLTLIPWISHIREIGCNAIYIGPLFESVGHGYETTDYKKLDSRLGTNEDLKEFVKACHAQGVRVIFDGVFNHTGRDFFAFQDIKKNREQSAYKDWYCNVNFWGNNEYNDGFTYDNWGGYNLLVKLNQRNPAVVAYICDVISFWVSEFDVDGIRLDAADVLDFDFMKALRQRANQVKPEFWLMGEVIHGDYNRWANEDTLHSVTNYHLHKALYSGNNDHNFFEIAHTVRQQSGMNCIKGGLKLYNFVDNHDVERIYTKLNNKEHFVPVHILLYTLPGIPSLYYGSEFAIEGKKERYSDDSLRPYLSYEENQNAIENNRFTRLIARLGKIRQSCSALSNGEYREVMLTNRQYAYVRSYNGTTVVIALNNDDNPAQMSLPADCESYTAAISGQKVNTCNGQLQVTIPGNSGEIYLPGEWNFDTLIEMKPVEAYEAVSVPDVEEVIASEEAAAVEEPIQEEAAAAEESIQEEAVAVEASIQEEAATVEAPIQEEAVAADDNQINKDILNKPYDQMTVEELQAVILDKLSKNGPVTDQMRKDVAENVYHNSLVNWANSFR